MYMYMYFSPIDRWFCCCLCMFFFLCVAAVGRENSFVEKAYNESSFRCLVNIKIKIKTRLTFAIFLRETKFNFLHVSFFDELC